MEKYKKYHGFIVGLLLFIFSLLLLVTACKQSVTKIDFNGNIEVLNALDNGTITKGDTIRVEITEIEENPVFGEVVWLGDYMYMVGNTAALETGDIVTFEIKDARLLMDLWAIQYDSVGDM